MNNNPNRKSALKVSILVLLGWMMGISALFSAPLDAGWRLWLDPKAAWQDDRLYLPGEVQIDKLPTNPPTGGWGVLDDHAGIPVTLPATVEQYYWGRQPCEVSPSDKPSDVVEVRSPYKGVSWWYRKFSAPKLKEGEKLELSFRGARLRAEVYVNGRLAGYNLITELPFTADATPALREGSENLLAVRITNPGGNFEWGDGGAFPWGKYNIPDSHGFGGLDGGITMTVRGPVCVSDLATLNNPDPRTVTLIAEIHSTGPAYDGPVALAITREGNRVWSGSVHATVPANGTVSVSQNATADGAELWDVGHPVLYQASAQLAGIDHSDRAQTFGFRWFTPEGIGQDAKLRLNGRRIVVRSAISWGYWAPDGLFPDQNAVNREIAAVRAIELDGLNSHRHMPKPLVLEGFDQAGLLRYCEPGAGDNAIDDSKPMYFGGSPKTPVTDTTGNGGAPDSFKNRYELAKILGMIKADRSHPCVTVWTLHNETYRDLHNPKIYYVLRKMREADPSRTVLLKSGYPSVGEAWLKPYSTDFQYDDMTGYSGWRDTHTCDGYPGVWTDTMYKSPADFMYRTDITKEIVGWGEMATGASSDNDTKAAEWYRTHNVPGYDRAAHEAILQTYEKFLKDEGFLSSYPTPAVLEREIGQKHYFGAARIMENGRICDANDFLTLSGWESTTVDNHSGLVDELRDLKADPSELKRACGKELLVIRPRRYVVAKGGTVVFDVYAVNEADRKGAYILNLEATGSDGVSLFKASVPVELKGSEIFAQLLKDNNTFTANKEGLVAITASISNSRLSPVLTRSEPVWIVDVNPAPIHETIAVAGATKRLQNALHDRLGIDPLPLADARGPVDVIVADSTDGPAFSWGHVEAGDDAKSLPGLYKSEAWGEPGVITSYCGIANGVAHVELHFAETFFKEQGQRVFNVGLNGRTVLENFDPCKEAGGPNLPVVKTMDVDVKDGSLRLSNEPPNKDHFMIAAIKITDAKGKIIREVFRKDPYTDPDGKTWNPVKYAGIDWEGILPDVLRRVQNDGTRLVLLTGGNGDTEEALASLANRQVFNYSGMVGSNQGASWKGTWYFSKKHWLLDGLPSGSVLDWPFQNNGNTANGFMISGPGVEAAIGYGRDHTLHIGSGAAIVKYGKGEIVLFCIPGLVQSFATGEWHDFHPLTAERMIYNALNTKTHSPGSHW